MTGSRDDDARVASDDAGGSNDTDDEWTGWTPSHDRVRRALEEEAAASWDGAFGASALVGLLWGLAVFALLAVLMGFDFFSVRGQPTEQLTIVAVQPSGTMEICGSRALMPNTPGERTTYRSTNPPAGLPAEFSVTHCPWDEVVGDMVAARRTGTSEDDFYPDPLEGVGDWLGFAGVFGVVAGVVATGLSLANIGWEVRQARARRRVTQEASVASREHDTRQPPSDDTR